MKINVSWRKKVLSLVLCVAVMLSVMVLGAGAAFSDQDQIENTEAVEMATALKIIDGYEDGSYHPERNIKRSEMCKMICIALNGGKAPATSTKDDPTFSDIDGHWAEGFIEYCYTEGVVSGVGDGRFNPDGNVTVTQAAKMLLVALGYNADVEQFNGGNWSLYVNVKANQDGIYKDLEGIDTASALNRDDAAQMIWNAMQAYVINKQSSIDVTTGDVTEHYVKSETTTMLMKKYNAVVKQGYLTDFTYDEVKGEWDYTFDARANFGGNAIDANKAIGSYSEAGVYSNKTLTSSTDYTDFYGQQVKVVYDVDDSDVVYGVFANDSAVIASGASGDFDKYDDTARTVRVSSVDYKMGNTADNINVYNNGVGDAGIDLDELVANDANLYNAFTFKLVDNNGDNKVDAVIRTPMTVAKITYVGSNTISFNNNAGANLNKEDLNLYEGYAKDDWTYVIPAVNSSTEQMTVVKAELQTGTVNAVRGDDTANTYTEYQLGDKWYHETTSATYTLDEADVNDTVEYVTLGSTVFHMEITDAAYTTKDIAMVITAGTKTSNNTNVSKNTVEAKLLFANGDTSVVTVDKYYEANADGTSTAHDVTSNPAPIVEMIGSLVTFRVDDGDYELTLIGDNNQAGFKDYYSGAGYSDEKVAGRELADDAVVFVMKGTAGIASAANDGDVYTGKEFKNTFGSSQIFGQSGQALVSTENGFNYAKVAGIVSTTLPTINVGTNYGYLTAMPSRSSVDGTLYLNFTMWTANGEVTGTYESTKAPSEYPKGALVSYDVDTTSSARSADLTLKNVNLVTNFSTTAVTGWDESKGKIEFLNGVTSKVDSDTVIIYVDSQEMTGAEGGSIELGDDTNGDKIIDQNNVRYVGTSTSISLLLVDVENNMAAAPTPGLVSLTPDMTADDVESAIDEALTANKTATVDLSQVNAEPTIAVDNGESLTIVGMKDGKDVSVDMSGTSTLNVNTTVKNLDVDVASTSTVNFNGAKIFGTDGVIDWADATSISALNLKADDKGVVTATTSSATAITVDAAQLGNTVLALADSGTDLATVTAHGQTLIADSNSVLGTNTNLAKIQLTSRGVNVIDDVTATLDKIANATDKLELTISEGKTLTHDTSKTIQATDGAAVVSAMKDKSVTLVSGKVTLGASGSVKWNGATVAHVTTSSVTAAVVNGSLVAELGSDGTLEINDVTFTGGTVTVAANGTVTTAGAVALNTTDIDAATTVNVASGTTTVTATATDAAVLTVNVAKDATVKLPVATMTANKLVVKAVAGASVNFNDESTLKLATGSADVTVTATGATAFSVAASGNVIVADTFTVLTEMTAFNLTNGAKFVGTAGSKITVESGAALAASTGDFYTGASTGATKVTSGNLTADKTYTWTAGMTVTGQDGTSTGWLQDA